MKKKKKRGVDMPEEKDKVQDTQAAEPAPVTEETAEETVQTEVVPTQEEWKQALETAVKQRDEYLALAQRAQADYQNFKRRNATVRADAYDDGVRETMAALLPALDNLDRALSTETADAAKLAEGVEMTRRQLLEAMGKMGLEEVPALGEEFNPDLHNAVMRSDEGENGKILEVFQKGYRVKERMIRYAMVKVSSK